MTTQDQKYSQALVRGAQLMMQHGLNDWTVKLHSKRRVLADCSVRTRTIRYSKHFLTITTPEQLEGVTLHEIAHALVGPGHGHDLVFKRKVIEIGGDPNYSHASVKDPVSTHKYNLICPECGTASKSNRKRDYICGKCSRDKGERVTLVAVENVLTVVPWPV
jgi:predicted SprT family Zn-dependent metalloprotease